MSLAEPLLAGQDNLLNHDLTSCAALMAEWGEKPFRARQLLKWIHQKGVIDFDEMTNLSLSFREALKLAAYITPLEVISRHVSSDGTCKWLFRIGADGSAIETVYIPDGERATVCISSQVGCALNCSFCSTGKEGFNRNLTVAEIIGQLWMVVHRLRPEGAPRVTNVVMMGMGEPLLNYGPVLSAMQLMLDDDLYGLSKYRVTLSTSGVLPMMERLKNESPVALAVSLHAADNDLRNQLVPINKKYPLEQLIPLCRSYYGEDNKRRHVTFEYVMLAGVNDQPSHAKALMNLLSGVSCKINLIPFNPFPGSHYVCSDEETIRDFQMRLIKAGFNTRVRAPRGRDIDSACGQLAGEVRDRTGRFERWQRTGRLVVEQTRGDRA